VENGWIAEDDDVALPMARRYLQPLADQGIDTLILGCTHFPLLAPIITKILGDGVTLIDAGREAAVACVSLLQANDALNLTKKAGDRTFYVTDRPDGFIQVADRFLGCRVDGDIHTVDIDLL
jgi:glutamate racemase